MIFSNGVTTAVEHKEWLKEMRGWLIVLATLAASVTYQAGLNPPGGFWQDSNGHLAGNPVLHDGPFVKRYLTFYYFNATAFATSLVIIILLLNERFYMSEAKVAALTLTTMVDLMSLVGAYIAGSTRNMANSIYIIVLTCFLFVCVVYIARYSPLASSCCMHTLHCEIINHSRYICLPNNVLGCCRPCASSCSSCRRGYTGWPKRGGCR